MAENDSLVIVYVVGAVRRDSVVACLGLIILHFTKLDV